MKKLPKFVMALVVASLLAGGISSCKSKKKLAREKEAVDYAVKVKQAKTDLTAILNGNTGWSVEQQAQRVKAIQSYNIDDNDVIKLTGKAQEKINALKAEEERKTEEEKLRREEEAQKKTQQSKFAKFNNAFEEIATADNVNLSNRRIDEALKLFATPDVPVLIIISQINGINDYDRPTTVARFLNYLKDTKNYNYRVESVKKNTFGKITELELIKK